MTPDAELLLLSWSQLQNALLYADDAGYRAAMAELAARLERDCGIRDLQLLARSLDAYTVSFTLAGEQRLHTFAADVVEDFT